MPASFFFYDLETSGFDPKSARIVQFAGQRTDAELNPVGEPFNIVIKLTPDVLPDPDAVLVTGITPQMTLADGITEAEFVKLFHAEICQPQTTFLGYNSVRFDDEFMRHTLYRNFCDAYEWQWCDDCTRWDLLDVVRMTRALRPAGINWPFSPEGQKSNRLELLAALNNLVHDQAHDALSDVRATIDVARMLRERQPKLFDYLFTMRHKKQVSILLNSAQPFVYTSGAYPSETDKTTVVMTLATDTKTSGAWVYDLRHDPTPYMAMTVEQLADVMRWWPYAERRKRVQSPVKLLRPNRCPAVAPLSVLDAASQQRLYIDLAVIKSHAQILRTDTQFGERVIAAQALVSNKPEQTEMVSSQHHVDGQLYDGFIETHDKKIMKELCQAQPAAVHTYQERFHDTRLQTLVGLYKARNHPQSLNGEERAAWELFCQQRLFDGGMSSLYSTHIARLQALALTNISDNQRYLLEELRLYAESLMPAEG